MRKLGYLLVLLGLFATKAQAQWYQITGPGGTFGYQYQYFFDPVTSAPVGSVGVLKQYSFGNCGPAYINNPPAFCGVYPYYIGNCGRTGYQYVFSQSVTDIRLKFASLNDDDTIRISIPCKNPPGPNNCTPTTIALTPANLVNWTSSCTPTGNYAIITNKGQLTAKNQPSGYSDIEVDIQNPYPPFVIDSIRVDHQSHFPGPFGGTWTSDGVVYSIEWKRDSCNLRLNLQADSPRCEGKDIKIIAVDLPNTKHHWFTRFNNYSDGPGHIGTIPNAQVVNSGWYYDSAVRGGCTYKDSININIDKTPTFPGLVQVGPKCPGQDDTLTGQSSGASGITYTWYKPSDPTFFAGGNPLILKNVQASDATTYCLYAASTNGCVSDTNCKYVAVNPPAHAALSYQVYPKCKGADSVVFTNYSVGGTTFSSWDFGDNTPISNIVNAIHVYQSTSYPASYSVHLTVGSSVCQDDTTFTVAFDHPLIASFTTDHDSVCQGAPITFTNTSTTTAGSVPHYLWNYGDGKTYNDIQESHTYTRYGTYHMFLTSTDDYNKGCEDTAHRIIQIDSAGSIVFFPSDTMVCVGDVVKFSGEYSPVGIVNATWDFADNNTLLNDKSSMHAYDRIPQDPNTVYHVTFTGDYRVCPDTTFGMDIHVNAMPVVDLGPDTTLCPNGQPVTIRDVINAGKPGFAWSWNTDTKDTTSSIRVYHPGTYSVSADINGCVTTDSVTIFKKCYVDIPNIFTPNGDGNNDYFLPREWLSRGITKFNMVIFNRWGGKVFETTSISGRGWDGKFNGEDQPTGVYVYMIEATFENKDSEKYQGNITLLR